MMFRLVNAKKADAVEFQHNWEKKQIERQFELRTREVFAENAKLREQVNALNGHFSTIMFNFRLLTKSINAWQADVEANSDIAADESENVEISTDGQS